VNVVIGIDTLIEKDNATVLLEPLIHMFPKAQILTLCHVQGQFKSPIENLQITSTFLSKFVASKFDFYHRTSLIPSACKTLKVPKDTDLFISLSSGFAHCFSCPDSVKHVSYIFEYSKFFKNDTTFWQQIFYPYAKNFQKKCLDKVDEVVYSSRSLAKALNANENSKVIIPVFGIDDFPFVVDDEHPYKFDHYVAVSNGVNISEFKLLLDTFVENKLELKIVGQDSAFEKYKSYENLEFVGDHCNGPISFNTHFAKALIDLTDDEFPAHSIGALCNGRPVLIKRTDTNLEFIPSEFAFFIDDVNKDSLSSLITEIEEKHESFDRKVLRRKALKYNGRIFKTKLHKILGTFER
jgi:hypothetical protein